MLTPPETPYDQATRAFRRLTAFVHAPWPPQPDSTAPAWLATPEGLAWLEAWTSGDLDRAGQIFDEASTRVFEDLWETRPIPAPTEETHD
jgi:hypothetical protein